MLDHLSFISCSSIYLSIYIKQKAGAQKLNPTELKHRCHDWRIIQFKIEVFKSVC